MTRQEHVRWCENCQNSKLSRNGILCSLTNLKANFDVICKDYILDREIAMKNDENNILQKYSDSYKIELVKMSKQYKKKYDLPSEIEIAVQSSIYVLYTFFFIPLILILLGISFLEETDYINAIAIFIFASLLIALLLYFIIGFKEDKTLMILLNSKSIKIRDTNFVFKEYKYEHIQIFRYIPENGTIKHPTNRYIIIKPFNSKEIIYNISMLDYSPKEIYDFIADYQSNSSWN